MFPARLALGVRVLVLSMLPSALDMSRRCDATDAATAGSDLRVLYAGNPESDRTADFKQLLEQHFAKVETANYETFKPADAADFDVVIFDWPSIYIRDEYGKIDMAKMELKQPTPPELGPDFDRPTVLIGAAGGGIAMRQQLAINWKCLCLENDAHDVNLDHAIFQGPLPVRMEFHEREKPADYFLSPGMKKIGEMIPVWTVHEKTFPEIDPGLVASRERFVDTPDTEVISGGINGKGPSAVAIGRHGSYLLWGFAGAPEQMTESGRNALINAVCYIDKFDGHKAGPVLQAATRDSFVERVFVLRSTSDEYIDAQVRNFKQMMKDVPLPTEQLAKVADDPEAHLRGMYGPIAGLALMQLPLSVLARSQGDAAKILQYYEENLEYLRTDGAGRFAVDADAKELGVSNRSPELLETCIALLEAQQNAALAQRVLERYTGERFADAEAWRKWLQASGAELRFNESRGMFVAAK